MYNRENIANRNEESPDRSLTPSNSTNSNDQPSQESWLNTPHEELVREIKTAIANAREEAEAAGQQFDPVRWVGDRLTKATSSVLGEARQQRFDASYAWDALSQSRIQDDEFRKAIGMTLMAETAMRQSNRVTLRPESVKLLHAIADAVGVPFNPEQKTVDLLPNQKQKDLFREIHPTIARKIGL